MDQDHQADDGYSQNHGMDDQMVVSLVAPEVSSQGVSEVETKLAVFPD